MSEFNTPWLDPASMDASSPAQWRIAVSDDYGWDVFVEVDGRVLSTMHCSDWHRVERLCSRIERSLAAADGSCLGAPPGEVK